MLGILIGVCFLALLLTLFFIAILQPIAKKVGLVDIPGGRKQHFSPIPLTGGIGMFLGFSFTCLTLPISLAHYRSFIAGAGLLVFIGILDDLHELSRRSRLAGQIIATIVMTVGGHNVLDNLGHLLGGQELQLGYLAIPFTIFVSVATINAMNMMDGVDGLAGSLTFIQLSTAALLAKIVGYESIYLVLLVLIFALLGFLLLNFPFPKRLNAHSFMGDSGSMFLGFSLVWFLIDLSQLPVNALSPVTILWILTIPLFDLTTVFFMRLKNRRSPFLAARDHLHHLLTNYGYSRIKCTLFISTIALFFNIVGISGYLIHIPDYIMFLFWLSLFVLYFICVNYYWSKHVVYVEP